MPTSDEPTERRVRTLSERHARKGHGTVFYVVLFVTAVAVLNAVFGERGLLAMRRAHEEQAALAASLERAREENRQLREQARKLLEDPATIEDIARRELNLIRPGETVFIIKDLPPAGKK